MSDSRPREVCLWDEEDDEHKVQTLSEEQQAIVNSVVEGCNASGISKAGTGKTTTSLSVAREFHRKHRQKTLLLTYNAALKEETRVRLRKQGLSYCMEAHSYHAAAYKFFPAQSSSSGADDALIRNAMDVSAKHTLDFGVLIIDEAQDMTELYYQFVCHLLSQFTQPPVLLLLGDPFQQIFRYAGADIRFLTDPESHFGHLVRASPFRRHHLHTSYRITHEMAQFINQFLNPMNLRFAVQDSVWKTFGPQVESWWGEGIRANPDRAPEPESVVYQDVNFFAPDELQREVEIVAQHCNTPDCGREQLAFLSKDMTGKAPINQVVERLSRHSHENCIVLRGDTHHDLSGSSRSQVMQQKLTFSTIHKFKGLERQVVVVCGMDQHYEKGRSDRNFWDHLDLFNVFYVACTRAKNRLIIWKNRGEQDYVTKRQRSSGVAHRPILYRCRVKDLFSYVPFDETLSRFGHGLSTTALEEAPGVDRLQFDSEDRLIAGRAPGTKEDVSPILGVMVELLILRECQRDLPRYSYAQVLNAFQHSKESASEVHEFLQTMYAKGEERDLLDLARVAIAIFAIQSGFIHVWRQIDGEAFCDWLRQNESMVQTCVDNVQRMLAQLLHVQADWSALASHIEFFPNLELPYEYSWFQQRFKPLISGQIDLLLDNQILVELKVSCGLQVDHALQAQLYASVLWCLQKVEYTPIVMIANLGEMHQVNLTLTPSVPGVHLHEELVYRNAKRKLLQPFIPSVMQEELTPPVKKRKRRSRF